MQVSLPEKVIHCGGGLRYRPPRSLLRGRLEEQRRDVLISLKASIAISRPAPVIEVRANEKAAEEDSRGRVVDMIV